MYTMLVVDDNPADRRGICSLFDWGGLGIEIIDTCSNGERAMEVLSQRAVDIVLTDVAMPVMNGISLAQGLRASHPRTKVVFMSCHSDFEYAKSAVDMAIHGYVLKPIIPDELLAVIRKLTDELTEEAGRQAEKERMIGQLKDMLPMVQEQFLKEILLGNCYQLDDIERRMHFLRLAIAPRGRVCVLSIVLEEFDTRTRDMPAEDVYFISFTVKNIISAQSNAQVDVHPVQFSGKEYSAVVFFGAPAEETNAADTVDIAVALHSAILSSLDLSAIVGISRTAADMSCAHALYRQSVEAVNTQFSGGSNPIIQYELIESESFAVTDRSVDLGTLYRDIKDLVVMGDETADAKMVDRYLQTEKAALTENYVKSISFSIANMIAVVLNEYGYSFSDVCGADMVVWEKLGAMKSIGNVRRWLLDVFKTIRGHFADKNQSRGVKLVESADHPDTTASRFRWNTSRAPRLSARATRTAS
jgi:DNA-binding NarL/FixJ family response regulator